METGAALWPGGQVYLASSRVLRPVQKRWTQGMAAKVACWHSRTQEAEGRLIVWGQPELHSNILSQKKKERKSRGRQKITNSPKMNKHCCFVLGDRASCCPASPSTCCVAKADLELLVCLLPSPIMLACRDGFHTQLNVYLLCLSFYKAEWGGGTATEHG